MKKARKVRSSSSDRVFYAIIVVLLSLVSLCVLYPIIYVVSCSFSTPRSVLSGEVILFPTEFSLEGYQGVFKYKNVWVGFRNSIFYTVVGTLLNVVATIMTAYPLSRADLPGRSVVTKVFSFTMIFGGGMIPGYLLLKNLHMLNTVWSQFIPGLIVVYHVIIMRTFFQSSIPGELLEASKIDGCSDINYLTKVVLPLSKSIIAVITLYRIVGHWNAYFNAFMYLSDRNLYPLQVFLREILIASQVDADLLTAGADAPPIGLEHVVKYSLIVVATVPMLVIYPFVQKHFVKGVMVGAIKG